jgi:hypothetical protein
MMTSAYDLLVQFDAHRNGLPEEWHDWAADISRGLQSLAAAPEAPEHPSLGLAKPVAWMYEVKYDWMANPEVGFTIRYEDFDPKCLTPLYTHTSDDAKDAARYRWLRMDAEFRGCSTNFSDDDCFNSGIELDEALDKAMREKGSN